MAEAVNTKKMGYKEIIFSHYLCEMQLQQYLSYYLCETWENETDYFLSNNCDDV